METFELIRSNTDIFYKCPVGYHAAENTIPVVVSDEGTGSSINQNQEIDVDSTIDLNIGKVLISVAQRLC